MKGKQFPLFEISLHLLLSAFIVYVMLTYLPTLKLFYKSIFIFITIAVVLLDMYIVAFKNKAYLKTTRICLIILAIFTFIVFLIYYLTSFLVLTDDYGIERVLRDHASAAKFIYVLICFCQPIMLPIPEAVTVPAGSAVFGSLPAAILSFVGTMTGIVVMFFIARVGGQKVVLKLVKEKHLKKYQEYVGKNETIILSILFIVPILPDEIICVGAGISGVSFVRFLIIASIAKLITSFLLAYSVELAKALSLSSSEIVLACSLILGFLFVISLLIKRILKNDKTTSKLNG